MIAITYLFFPLGYSLFMTYRHPIRKCPIPTKLKFATWRMRDDPTWAEKVLWKELRLKRLDGFRFRQQHVIGKCIADFYCHEAKLVIEVDGSSHDNRKVQDFYRDQFMKGLGLTVLRLTNEEVLNRMESVKEKIRVLLAPLPSKGEGL